MNGWMDGTWNGPLLLSSPFSNYGYIALSPSTLYHLLSSLERDWSCWLASVHRSTLPLIGSLLALSHVFHFLSDSFFWLDFVPLVFHLSFMCWWLVNPFSYHYLINEWLRFLFLFRYCLKKKLWGKKTVRFLVNKINTDAIYKVSMMKKSF